MISLSSKPARSGSLSAAAIASSRIVCHSIMLKAILGKTVVPITPAALIYLSRNSVQISKYSKSTILKAR
jgi:hypothetical protein